MKLTATLRFLISLWIGKTVFFVSRLTGKKGTTLPGALALKVFPDLTGRLAKQLPQGTIMVTGTNGKTTTSNMLAQVLTTKGLKLTFNRAGANLVTGVTTAFLNSCNWNGRMSTDLALLEVDEATVAKVVSAVRPHTVVITNFFRDQLDRYGELDKTVALVKDSMHKYLPKARLVLNADDPLVAQIGAGRENVVYYGVSSSPYSSVESTQAREAKYCSICGHTYDYELYHYGQLGIYHCPNCGFKRPDPLVLAQGVKLNGIEGSSFRLGDVEINLQHQGFYNIYNALAASAAALSMRVDTETVKHGLEEFAPQAGRMEQFSISETRITLCLVKNPTGFNEVIRAMVQGDKPMGLLIAINDNAADGRDISWLWDVDFESLQGKVDFAVCCGIRAEEIAVRLKYAGIGHEKLIMIKDLSKALNFLVDTVRMDQGVYVLPTYTALFPMRELMGNLRRKAYAS